MKQEQLFDLAVVGAGPAGMRAAICARKAGLSVVVLDSQDAPGGQIWRWIQHNAKQKIMDILGTDYQRGLSVVTQFLACGAIFLPKAQVNRIEPGWDVEYLHDAELHRVQARYLLLAVGAQERPVPFPGWTLPGVMGVGAAQILLKTAGQLPKGPIVIAGNGPLPLLYQHQMLMADGMPAAYLDTTPQGIVRRSISQFGNALSIPSQLWKGLKWLPILRKIPHINDVTMLSAQGEHRLETVCYETGNGKHNEIKASTLLVHEGLVPNHQLAVSCGAKIHWDQQQNLFGLTHDSWMAADSNTLFVAGDGVRIGGAVQAELEGELASLGILRKMGALTTQQEKRAILLRRKNANQIRFRAFLDTLYPPRLAMRVPEDNTIICRCEELRARTLKDTIIQGACKGPNQLKAFTRVGMGPCQGRQCAYSVHQMLKTETGLSADETGLFRPRPPFAPVTVGALAMQQNKNPCHLEPSHE